MGRFVFLHSTGLDFLDAVEASIKSTVCSHKKCPPPCPANRNTPGSGLNWPTPGGLAKAMFRPEMSLEIRTCLPFCLLSVRRPLNLGMEILQGSLFQCARLDFAQNALFFQEIPDITAPESLWDSLRNGAFHPEGIGIIQPSVAPKVFGATLGNRANGFVNPARVG